MKVQELMEGARDALSVKRVFGEPYEKDGITIIPVATFGGGGGGGGDNRPEGGSGAGFGLAAKPAGAYVVKDGVVKWQPALDLNRIVSAATVVALAVLMTVRGMMRSRSKFRRAKLKRKTG